MRSIFFVMLFASPAVAGSLDVDFGLQATKTSWAGDHGGGAALDVGYWFLPWLGASFVGKEQYATVDDRYLSYFSFNAETRWRWFRLSAGVVHQHEEPRAAIMEQPVQSLFGVGDGIRHRMAARAGLTFAWPLNEIVYVALNTDATRFSEGDKGPPWMLSAGASLGIVYDFSRPR